MLRAIRLTILLLSGAFVGFALGPWQVLTGRVRVSGVDVAVATLVCTLVGTLAGLCTELAVRLLLAEKLRFNIRDLMAITTLVAIILVLVMLLP
jgi:hypothetical protein